MPLDMSREVFVTCAVTGSGNTQDKSRHVPRSPKEIADDAIAAARKGAAIVHCHVRDPESGKPSRDLSLYREVTDRIRSADVDLILNLTCGMGGDLFLGPNEEPLPIEVEGTDLIGVSARLAHIVECRPEICTIDCGSMNFGDAGLIMVNTPGILRDMGAVISEHGVQAEIEVFDTGHLWFAKQILAEGVLKSPALIQFCMGVPWGAPNDLNTLMAMVNNAPRDCTWSAFSLGRDQMAYVAAAILAGGNVRVGLEDNLYLEKGRLATNAELVARAVELITAMGVRLLGPGEVRSRLKLVKQNPKSAG
ncbi:3-keto-5-aminohexanoate cleavage protein [Mesorhizobium temperatum]|uniref:NADPH dependent quinone reductase n=1 Tax=Mesorhizobium temperatum TaxID=241416 RepID=A0A271LK00_9HYPH|nr:3-keto-5-aminohexanoate cleavage protein [Mesorhizobium temperatum]PAQ07630.1 NADPH dependent quinone reductase [Mesorhizobium temperatum]